MDDHGRARFRLDRGDERLWDAGAPVPLTRKAFELLRLFAENPNRLLTKEEIRDRLWRGVHVTEGLIKEYVHDLRLALGDDPRAPAFIETVRGRGYRLVGEVEVTGASPSEPTAGPGSDLPSVAVLPLDNMTGEERFASWCHGLADDLITDLARLPDLVVRRGRNPGAADPVAAARDLCATYVVRGSMRMIGERLRLNLHLLRTWDGSTAWADRYEFEPDGFARAQNEMLACIAPEMGAIHRAIWRDEVRRIERKPVGELSGHELFVLGFHLEERHERQSGLRAFDLLQRALKLDPDRSRAWLALGWTCYQISRENWAAEPQKYQKLEREAYVRASRLQPNDPFAAMEIASQRAVRGDRAAACDGFHSALDLGQNCPILISELSKYFAMVLDDPDAALKLLARSREINPRCSDSYFMNKARVSYFAGDFEGALVAAVRAPDILNVRLFEILSLAQLDRRADLRDRRRRFAARYPKFRLADFMRDPPVTGERARKALLDGAEKARLQ